MLPSALRLRCCATPMPASARARVGKVEAPSAAEAPLPGEALLLIIRGRFALRASRLSTGSPGALPAPALAPAGRGFSPPDRGLLPAELAWLAPALVAEL